MAMGKNFLKTLSEVVARQNSMGDVLVTPEGTVIYKLEDSWETDVIGKDAAITSVVTALELEDALNDEKVETLIVPKDASITKEILFRIVDRCGGDKTIFAQGF